MPERERPGPAIGGVGGQGNGRRVNGSANRLTARQEEVLLYCENHGYYEIPRRATLRQLAKGLGISATSLSLILRRGEAKLVRAMARQHQEGLAADARMQVTPLPPKQ